MQNNLEKLRLEVDKIDSKIVDLLNQRLEISRSIGSVKSKLCLNTFDVEREKEIVDRLVKLSNNKDQIGEVYKIIFKYSKLEQRR